MWEGAVGCVSGWPRLLAARGAGAAAACVTRHLASCRAFTPPCTLPYCCAQLMIRGFLAANPELRQQQPGAQAAGGEHHGQQAGSTAAETVGAGGAAAAMGGGDAEAQGGTADSEADGAGGAGGGAAAERVGKGGKLEHEPIEQLAQDGEVGQVLPQQQDQRALGEGGGSGEGGEGVGSEEGGDGRRAG